ncbi:MAG: 4-hydroxy-tetrahydrodipicolinate synthase [Ruminococcaceae bacterium]|nr:4-hydroxy-tetrahydrodipicolinate synthase [Oscillospiraceae bacterium]
MKSLLFSGVGTALITPFADGKVDYAALKRLCAYQADHGADALIVCGTTGESPTLTAIEKLRIVAAACEAVEGKIPVIAGTTTNDTTYSMRLSRLAVKEGADGILAVTPYYNRPTAEGLLAHFQAIAETSERPLILYNIPSRAGCEISDAVYDGLADHPLIAGVKEASGSVSRAASLVAAYGDDLPLYSGNDDLTLPILSIGGKGVISVASNLFPTEMHTLCVLWKSGRVSECLSLYRDILPLMHALFLETNPIPVKAAMAELGFCSPEIRLPLTEAKPTTMARLIPAMQPLLG